jgi:hypothetical protein
LDLSTFISSIKPRFCFSYAADVSMHLEAISIFFITFSRVMTSPFGIMRPMSPVAASRTLVIAFWVMAVL